MSLKVIVSLCTTLDFLCLKKTLQDTQGLDQDYWKCCSSPFEGIEFFQPNHRNEVVRTNS